MYQYTQRSNRHAQFRPDGTGRDTYIHGDPTLRHGNLFAGPRPSVLRPLAATRSSPGPEGSSPPSPGSTRARRSPSPTTQPRMTCLSETTYTLPEYPPKSFFPRESPSPVPMTDAFNSSNTFANSQTNTQTNTQNARSRRHPSSPAQMQLSPLSDSQLHQTSLSYSGHAPGRRDLVGVSTDHALANYAAAGSASRFVAEAQVARLPDACSLPIGMDAKNMQSRNQRPASGEIQTRSQPLDFIPGYAGHVVHPHETVGLKRTSRFPAAAELADPLVEKPKQSLHTRESPAPGSSHIAGYAGYVPRSVKIDS
eukprot:TRINITY_DN14314_c0_g1_i1.p1 TRINITY_DN14314_c0_g1~~TRINITY_DN14314_c0_g1_i1.p1  ORF type:complete len:310 (+),score=45.17 TRINITY_DN14314_c0_g1_i1:80-1009(+)